MKTKLIIILFALPLLPGVGVKAQTGGEVNKQQQRYFEINKNIEIFNALLREVDMFYVDSVDLTKVMRAGIDNMLSTLDPYTEYYNENDLKDFNIQITGEYAGVGSGIGFKDDRIIITEPFEGKPAAKAGLKTGDIILQIDGKDMTVCEKKEGEAYGQTLSSYVSSNLKGQPGTTLEIKVERPGVKKPVTLKVIREKIIMHPITYSGMVSPTTGYINFTNFSDKSAMDVKNAVIALKAQGAKSLIFDVRQNGGGVIEEAIQIVNMFVPKGKLVLSTKGKLKQTDRTYRTTVEPIDTEMPIVVLIDKNTASASEIVAGSLQDMDRAVLLGERTFGKGLVQTPREMPYGSGVKVTTSKYYIPSGRCVQAIDYSHRNADGSVGRTPDSLTTVFRTEAGRPVRDGGGVTPDITLGAKDKVPTITYYLANQYIVFDWATDWVVKNKTIDSPENFSITDEDYESFKTLVKSKDFQYDGMSGKSMSALKEVMEFEGYLKVADEEFKALEAKLVPNLDRDLETFKNEIKDLINLEIIKRYYYQNGEKLYLMKSDKELAKAIEVLNDKELYKNTLTKSDEEESQTKEVAVK